MDRTADRTAIIELVCAFENAFDEGDFDAHMSVWAKEMAFESPFATVSTHAEYRQWVEGFYAQVQEAEPTRHLLTNAVVSLDGDAARMVAYLTVFGQTSGKMLGTGRFDDELIRTKAGWRFARRRFSPDENVSVGQ